MRQVAHHKRIAIGKQKVFEIKIRINDLAHGTCTPETIESTMAWEDLQDLLLQTFDVHSASLHVQYRLSTEKKDTLLCDLTSQKQFDTLVDFIRPKRGNSKQAIVDLYNKRDVQAEGAQTISNQSGKVSIPIQIGSQLITVINLIEGKGKAEDIEHATPQWHHASKRS